MPNDSAWSPPSGTCLAPLRQVDRPRRSAAEVPSLEEMRKLPYEELLRPHRETLGYPLNIAQRNP